jgi:hypothetical protein
VKSVAKLTLAQAADLLERNRARESVANALSPPR